ncbi:MAG: beta-L-arabinofuranosidase domain-containing protein [Planctomycetota bacterium]
MSEMRVVRSLEPVAFEQTRVEDAFWSPRAIVNRNVTLEQQQRMLQETGRIDNFAKAAGRMRGEFVGKRYNDSDVYKWMEAVAYSLAVHPDAQLEAQLDAVIELVAAAQEADGYLNTYFRLVDPQRKWRNLGMMHELYCAGHLIEAALAHHAAAGKRSLLDVAVRLAEHIVSVHGRAGSRSIPGHQEIELALIALARRTGEARYLELARAFIDRRGQRPSAFELELADPSIPGNLDDYRTFFMREGRYDGSYVQDDQPLRESRDAVGHAVRAMYYYTAATDIARETAARGAANAELEAALDRLWRSVTERRMFVTGGIGSSRANEGFTEDYDLPEETGYAETCAAIGLALWSHRMLLWRGDARYADILELALYNGMLAGVSLDGKRFFYENPLASRGAHHRREWFDCACCPPNVSRILQSLGRFVYAKTSNGIYVNLFVGGSATVDLPAAGRVTIEQETRYPWDGEVTLTLRTARPERFFLMLRVPRWCQGYRVDVNGRSVTATPDGRGYIALERAWRSGDMVTLDLRLEVQRLRAHPRVRPLGGRVALRRGPLVYCFEEADNGWDPCLLELPRDRELVAAFDATLLEGVTVLRGEGSVIEEAAWGPALYRSEPRPRRAAMLTAVPYYTWDNRASGAMTVWARERVRA